MESAKRVKCCVRVRRALVARGDELLDGLICNFLDVFYIYVVVLAVS
jgi:hypothetical protein